MRQGCRLADRAVIGFERFADAVTHEHVVRSLPVEGGAQADDSGVASAETARGVIAVSGGVVGTEDAAWVPGLDPSGDAGGDGAGGDHGASPAFCRDELEGEDRQDIEGVGGQDDGGGPVGLPRYPEAAARGWDGLDAGRHAGGVSGDEQGIAETVGMDQAEVAAQPDGRVPEAAPLDEVSPEGGPAGVLVRRRGLTATVRERLAARRFGEEV